MPSLLHAAVRDAWEGRNSAQVFGDMLILIGDTKRRLLRRSVVVLNELCGGGIGTMRGPKVVLVSSSGFNDVVQAVRTFECLKQLRSSTILDVVDREPGEGKTIEEAFGTKVRVVTSAALRRSVPCWDSKSRKRVKGKAD